MSACPSCDHFGSRVLETRRLRNGWVRRRRECQLTNCGSRWYSFEIPDTDLDLSAQHHDNLKEVTKESK